MRTLNFDKLKNNWESSEGIKNWLHKPEYQDAIVGHLNSTWSNKRPDIIECFIGAIEFLLDELEKERNKNE